MVVLERCCGQTDKIVLYHSEDPGVFSLGNKNVTAAKAESFIFFVAWYGFLNYCFLIVS